MPPEFELSVILTTYERPKHLERCLASLALQRGVAGKFEVIVADDGSQDETQAVVEQFARRADFPVRFTTHPHEDYHVAKCRNDGVRASRGAYLLFNDGDCILPPEHLATHLRVGRPGVVWAGNGYRLTREASERIDLAAVNARDYRQFVTQAERQRLMRQWLKNKYYQLIGHPTKPKLDGCDFAVWRSDFEAVNGFDETFKGWGCEDDDLGMRLKRAGVRIDTILRYTRVYHLWHAADPSYPRVWRRGSNVDRLLAENRPTRCRCGLVRPADRPEGSESDSRSKTIHVRVPRPAAKPLWEGSLTPIGAQNNSK
jgi:glycosyltransferase involved in cell wall biosynthesis